jgi:hypothetical protein
MGLTLRFGEKVLVLVTNKERRERIVKLVSGCFDVHEVTNVDSALLSFEALPPNFFAAIVCDWELGEVTADQFCKVLANTRPESGAKRVIIGAPVILERDVAHAVLPFEFRLVDVLRLASHPTSQSEKTVARWDLAALI